MNTKWRQNWKKAVLVTLVLLILIIAMLVPSGTYYIYHNKHSIDLSDPNTAFDPLRSQLEDMKLILNGEAHGSVINYDLKLKFFEYLVSEIGITHFIDEISISAGYLINEYLKTGNSTILEYVMKSFRSTSAYSVENYQFLKNLRELHNEIDFEFTGMDIAHRLDLGIFALSHIIQQTTTTLPQSLTQLLKVNNRIISDDFSYNHYSASTWTDIFNIYEELYSNLSSDRTMYSSVISQHLYEFEEIIKNGYDGLEFVNLQQAERTDEALEFRENVILQNILDHQSVYNTSRYFGQWGNAHVLQSPLDIQFYTMSFASMLDETPEFEDKVYSIFLYYLDSSGIHTSDGNWNSYHITNNPPMKPNAILSWMFPDPNYLVILDRENSPFAQDFHLLRDPSESGLVTTDYLQSLFILGDSKSNTIFQ